MQNLKKLLLHSLFLLGLTVAAWCQEMSTQDGRTYVMTKDLAGATGTAAMTSPKDQGDYSLAFAWGEPVAGNVISSAPFQIISGYYGGLFGNGQTFSLLSWQVGRPGTKTFFQGPLQVGVPFDAPMTMTFSDQLDPSSLAKGVQITVAADHLGRASDAGVLFDLQISTDPAIHSLTIQPQGPWSGNTLYEVLLTPDLFNVDGFQLDQFTPHYFVTLLDPLQENVVLNPLLSAGAAAGDAGVSAMTIDIPKESLSHYSAILLSRDPMSSPLRADPKIIQEANDKARAAGGLYRVPLSIQEVNAYDINGDAMGPLSKPAYVTIDYGAISAAPGRSAGLVRPQSLALWTLDEKHRLWVKLPASQNAQGFHTVTTPISQFSVFALMGSSDASAIDSFAFPVPWRPHGPNAGTGPGQTGTEADGITFSNIPPECRVKIYTLAGDLVRDIQHSDVGALPGRESWDVKTTHGDPVASGVYLWRVESSVDGKNGKLMVIR